MSVILVGLNHKTAPLELREEFYLPGCGIQMVLQELKRVINEENGARCVLNEGAIISTCNRLEVYAAVSDPKAGWEAVERYLSRLQGMKVGDLHAHLYFKKGQQAIKHLMRVAAGLDSMVLGEAQILGQVGQAAIDAQTAGTMGLLLSHLFQRAVRVGKRARTETEIGRSTVSVSHAAIEKAEELCGSLAETNVLVVGAGEMAKAALRALESKRTKRLSIINRTYSRSQPLAERFNAHALNWFHLEDALTDADVVLTATDAPHILIGCPELEPVLPKRGDRPLLFIDIAVPRNVDPMIADYDHVDCVDIDQLKTVLDDNLAARRAAVPRIEEIIQDEVDRLYGWERSRSVVPVIVDLRRRIRKLLELEMREALASAQNGHKSIDIDRVTHRVANKILHEPSIRLKSHAANGNGIAYAEAIRDLFALDDVEGGVLADHSSDS